MAVMLKSGHLQAGQLAVITVNFEDRSFLCKQEYSI